MRRMNRISSLSALPCLLLALAIAPAHASGDDSKSKNVVSIPAFKACGGTWTEWSKDLKRLDLELEAWGRSQSKATLSSPDLKDSREGRFLRLYAAHLLPKDSPFARVHRHCWTSYVDFQKAIDAKRAEEAKENLEEWQACLTAGSVELPKEASELVSCWGKGPAK